ncbi:MAG: hypothetical protein JWQ32_2065 [Marmoricola sp.]|nr:hypothetical protein [Marmoricola sp.]
MNGALATTQAGFGPGRFGVPLVGPASPATTEMHSVASPGPADHNGNQLHAHNPLLAFGVIAAVMVGLMAFSTSVRVGKTKGTISIGETK